MLFLGLSVNNHEYEACKPDKFGNNEKPEPSLGWSIIVSQACNRPANEAAEKPYQNQDGNYSFFV